jgi:ribosomal protein S18 acetylase RimI-like enzyme
VREHLTFTVRAAEASDVEAVVETLWSVAAEGRWLGTEVPFDREARAASIHERLDQPGHALFVAVSTETAGPNESARAFGHVAVDVAPYGVANLGMAVAEDWRGRGVGTALLDAALDWARGTSAHKVALEVWPHNDAAISLYRRAGFVEEGRKVRHYRRANGELWDAVLMGRPLP